MNKLLSLKVNRDMLNKYYLPRLNEKSPVVPNFSRIRGMANPNKRRGFTGIEKDIIGLGQDFMEGLRRGMRLPSPPGVGRNRRRRF